MHATIFSNKIIESYIFIYLLYFKLYLYVCVSMWVFAHMNASSTETGGMGSCKLLDVRAGNGTQVLGKSSSLFLF